MKSYRTNLEFQSFLVTLISKEHIGRKRADREAEKTNEVELSTVQV